MGLPSEASPPAVLAPTSASAPPGEFTLAASLFVPPSPFSEEISDDESGSETSLTSRPASKKAQESDPRTLGGDPTCPVIEADSTPGRVDG